MEQAAAAVEGALTVETFLMMTKGRAMLGRGMGDAGGPAGQKRRSPKERESARALLIGSSSSRGNSFKS